MISHGGNILELSKIAKVSPEEILDFSASINPIGFPSWLRSTISKNISDLINYPDPDCKKLIKAISDTFNIDQTKITVGNGTSELIHAIPRAMAPKRCVVCTPCYIDYEKSAQRLKIKICHIPINNNLCINWPLLKSNIEDGDLIFLGHPNNPTGMLLDIDEIEKLITDHPKVNFVIDESFIDFIKNPPTLINRNYNNLIVLRSFTKFYAIAGLRLGFCVSNSIVAKNIKNQIPEWSVNSLAQSVGIMALHDRTFTESTRNIIEKNRVELFKSLLLIKNIKSFPSCTNFILCEILENSINAPELFNILLKEYKIAIRTCENFKGLSSNFFRIAVKTKEENEKLINHLKIIFNKKVRAKIKTPRKKVPAIMIQGIASNAGKTILSTALCRILFQDGYRVAPFKSQNMSLNSYVTKDGLEISRAQALQAQACRISPDIRMNPILLKPNSETGSQVIVCGKSIGNMNVSEFINYKPKVFEIVKECYDSLSSEYDVIVLEGAGSPGEVNLKSHDIVNMKMAQYAQSPVIIAGDIDRGGVYASFIGTMEVLEEWERKQVAGFLINRFRGDQSLLASANEYLNNYTGKSVLGVVRFQDKLDLPEEDSVSFKDSRPLHDRSNCEIDIAIIDLPHISNFTDFDALHEENDVGVRVVKKIDDLGNPDVIIIPGSKSSISDLRYLKNSGFEKALGLLFNKNLTEIIGICGGLQILGDAIYDPDQIESYITMEKGLGFLNIKTTISDKKILGLVKLKHKPSNIFVEGYEIHHGKTITNNCEIILGSNNSLRGIKNPEKLVWGTYVHGIFDKDEFRRWFIDKIRTRKGLEKYKGVPGIYNIEPAIDRLAKNVRKSIDMDALYRIAGLTTF